MVSITDGTVDVVVNMEELDDVQRAQIEDIVKRKTDITGENIIITPRRRRDERRTAVRPTGLGCLSRSVHRRRSPSSCGETVLAERLTGPFNLAKMADGNFSDRESLEEFYVSNIAAEIKKRRTFAIISHPDAGKTTLTEKFLLYGGAINLAGSVKGKATARHAVSDWMEIEKERGISVTSSVLQFNYDGYCINILDTPGHQDFSEDTYRTLMAADSAVMVIDASKGVEAPDPKAV